MVNLCIFWPHNFCAKCWKCNCKWIYYYKPIAQQQAHDGKKAQIETSITKFTKKVPRWETHKPFWKCWQKSGRISFVKNWGFLLHILEEIRKWEKVFESNPKSTHTILFLLATICPMRKFELFCVMNRVSYEKIFTLKGKKPLNWNCFKLQYS